jgi:DNA-binding response OmpR family regulator
MAESVLIADDDRSIQLTISTVLREAGYSPVIVSDGEEARARIEAGEERFSAVLLDWEMPKLTGIDLLLWLKKQTEYRDLPVVMQTSRDSVENIREGIDAGAFYYLTKPLNPQVLLSIVEAAVNDYGYKIALKERLAESQNPFGGIVDGTFRYRTLEEAERLTIWISNACPVPERTTLIHEILLNAVEHGNLGITYDEKSELMSAGTWGTEVRRRLRLPGYSEKYVEVRIDKSTEGMTVLVRDQGPGFDFSKYLGFDEARVFDNHGRGIAMAGMTMKLEYLGSGNTVRISIPFSNGY